MSNNRPPFPPVIDNSMLVEFRACPQKFYLANMEHWKPKVQSVHLHAGAAFARGLEVARRSFYDGTADAETAVGHGLAALVQAYGDFQCPADSAKSLERMAGALEFYFSQWPLATDTAKPVLGPSGKHWIEFSFVEPLPGLKHPETGDPILFSGRTDMIVGMANGTFIEDDKTATSLGAQWHNKWELRSQFTGYSWAARKVGIYTDGVLVRGVSILKTKYDSAQAITYRAQWEIDRWLEQTYRDIMRMMQLWEGGWWDFNLGDSCDSYGGCQFNRICKSNNPQEWLPMYFERRRWDPIRHVEIPL